MNRNLVAVGIAVVAFFALSGFLVAQQSIPDMNGGFETGSLVPWTGSNATVSASALRTGNYGVTITGLGARVSQNVASRLTAGTEYTFTAWVKVVVNGTSWGSPWLRVDRYADCGAGSYGSVSAVNNTANGWQKLAIRRTFTASELASPIYVCLIGFGFSGGTAYVDDISVDYQLAGVTPTNTPTPTSTQTRTPTPTNTPTSTPTPTSAPTVTPTPRWLVTIQWNVPGTPQYVPAKLVEIFAWRAGEPLTNFQFQMERCVTAGESCAEFAVVAMQRTDPTGEFDFIGEWNFRYRVTFDGVAVEFFVDSEKSYIPVAVWLP